VITIRVGKDEISLEQASDGWISQSIGGRRLDGISPCVEIRIKEPGVDVLLQTSACGRGGGGGRPPNVKESRILELWAEGRLNQADFTIGELTTFLRKLRGLC
jgi:hypothetical protein